MNNRDPRIIVLGNQKSGTTVIGSLLGELCGFTMTIDMPFDRRRDGHKLARGRLMISEFRRRNAKLFDSQLVKIPAMTFVAADVHGEFGDSKMLFVIRDPRSNIRSLLNRRGIPGNQQRLPLRSRIRHRLKGSPSMDSRVWGGDGKGYVGILADRWCRAVDQYNLIADHAALVKYEDFMSDKLTCIQRLATGFGFDAVGNISQRLDHQFQPAGDQRVSPEEFFGATNLAEIERVCAAKMEQFGY